jgi:hypothetical protein
MIWTTILGGVLLAGEPAEVEASDDVEAVEDALDDIDSRAGLEAAPPESDPSEAAAAVSAVGEEPKPPEEACKCEEEAAPEKDEPKPPVSGFLVGGGILTAAGVGSVVAGAALLGARRDDVAPEGGEPNVVDYRIAGAVALGVGGAALATGVALLLVHRRKKKGKGPATALVVPGPGAGLGLYARF